MIELTVNGKPRVKKILETDWGKLFLRYGSGQALQKA